MQTTGKNENSINVLYVADQYSRGGATDALIEMISLMREKGVKTCVLTGHKNEVGQRLEQNNIDYVYCGFRQFAFSKITHGKGFFLTTLLKPLYIIAFHLKNRKAMRIVEKELDVRQFDVIHSNVDRNDFGAIVARKYRKPHVWHLRECPTGHFHLSFNRIRPMAYMSQNADIFIAISEFVKDEWAKRGLQGNKIQVIYEGVDISDIGKHEGSYFSDGVKIICTGKITPKKGQYIVIDALNAIGEITEKIQLDFWGEVDEEYQRELTGRIKKNDNVSINFCGYNDEVKKKLKEYDIGINPSENEGYGRTTVEYMAAGLCTLVLDSGGNRELVKNGINGFKFSNHIELAEMLKELINNREKVSEISTAGQNWAIEEMNMKNNFNAVLEVYKKLMQRDGVE